jgi:hypothetical protein
MLFEFLSLVWIQNKEITLEFEFEILFQSNLPRPVWPIRPTGPTGLLAQPAHLGLAKPTRLGSGSVNRPSPAPFAHLSLSHRSLWRSGSPPLSPGDSGQLRWPPPSPPWAKHSPLHHLQSPPTRSVGRLLSEEIRGRIPLRILYLGRHRARYLAGFSPDACCASSRRPQCVCARRWKRRVRCSRWCRGEDFPRPRLVGRAGSAPPCLPGMHLGVWWASSSPLHLLFLLLAMVSDHTGQDQWAKLTDLALCCCCWMHASFS